MNRRHSIQKRLILDAAKRLDHPTAKDVLQEVGGEHPHISMGTVYRNLNLLSEEGILRKHAFPGSPDRFDTRTHPHYHIECAHCGRIFDIDAEYLAEIDKRAAQSTGFLVNSHSIFFKGVCPSCQKG